MPAKCNVCASGLLTIIGGHSNASAWHPHSPVYQCNIYCKITGNSRYWGNVHIHYRRNTRQELGACNKKLTINLPDRSQVKSTHLCLITIPGLPIVLTGHILPRLLIASLISICVLCKARWKVVFAKNYCNVIYNKKVILQGMKDPSTNLWMLMINATEDMIKKEDQVGKSQLNPQASQQPQIVVFTHSVHTRANAVKFAHQSLCNQ
jgi:hypothetical protein